MARNSNASYESGDNRRVPLSGIDTSLNYKEFATLDDFVRATNGTVLQTNRGCSFTFRDTGGWCPLGTANQWYRCMVVRYQNPIGTPYSVSGTVILAADGYLLYYGYISGTTSFTVEWTSIKDDGAIRAALPRTAGILNGHFVGGESGWVAMTSHDQNNINTRYRLQLGQDGSLLKYKSTDGGGSWQHIGYFRPQQEDNYFASVYYADSSPKDVTITGVLKFNTIVNNFGGCYNTSTGIYTCPVAGLYYANFTFYSNNTAVSQRAHISMGGRSYMVNGSHGHSISAMEFLPAGAQIFAGCPNSAFPFTFYSGVNHNRFSVNLVKRTT